jgi:hypothetical protein
MYLLLLACNELSLISGSVPYKMFLVNPIGILIEASIAFSCDGSVGNVKMGTAKIPRCLLLIVAIFFRSLA